MFYSKTQDKYIHEGTQFELDGVTYPPQWLYQATPEQKEAWDNLIRVFGDSARCLHWNSAHDIAEAGIKGLEAEAAKLLENPALQSLWDQYLLVAELTKENNDTKS